MVALRLIALLVALAPAAARTVTTLQPPGRDEYCRVVPAGRGVLPNGRWVSPVGDTVRITSDPFGLTLSPDGATAYVLHDRVVTAIDTASLRSARYPSYDGTLPTLVAEGSFMGLAVPRNGRVVYVSGGNAGTVVVLDSAELRPLVTISIDGELGGRAWTDSFVGDLALTRDGATLYALDQTNFRLVEIDLLAGRATRSFPTGRWPYGLALDADGRTAWVACAGVFDYPLVPGLTGANLRETALHAPPYEVGTREAEAGTIVDGREIPGLGSPHVPEAVAVWAIDLRSGEVVAQLKTGYQMGQMVEGLEVEGGASPNSVAVGRRWVYVTNATNDNISVIDSRTRRIVDHIHLGVAPELNRFRGLSPFGLALSPDESRLYVALMQLNAVAVVDTAARRMVGLIPTGWNPTKVAVSPDGRTLHVVTARGHGAGPNGGEGFQSPPQGTYVGDIQLGTYHRIAVPGAAALRDWTRQVRDNTFARVPVDDDGRNPLPPAAGLRRSPIRHIVYITKENRTYDEVFGQLEGGRGDAGLARYGTGRAVGDHRDVNVMPNHQKLAREFALSDNFYCDSDASVHGHRWMMGTYTNEFVETNSGIRRDRRIFSSAPGRRYVAGSSGVVYPEDYNEHGGLWEHLLRGGVHYRNYGQCLEFSAAEQEWDFTDTGVRMPVVFPMPRGLLSRTCLTYPTYNMDVPDIFRLEQFQTELRERWLSGAEPFPQLITLLLPNDHGAGNRPDQGYPYRESYMADNDLALGLLIQSLSRTPWWPNMLIIITEDDAQDGRDSVDAHRSLLLMVGPHVKRGYISHTHANFGAILKTIYLLLDLPPLNQFDAAASYLGDWFTPDADPRPYEAVPVDERIFDANRALARYDRGFDWRRAGNSPPLDGEEGFRESHAEQARP